MKNKKDKKHREQTPITDGDARPDKNVEPDPAIGSVAHKTEKQLTPERSADTDSLEDFKDAK